MNTKATVDYIMQRLGNTNRIAAKFEHGEHKIIADGREVALIADDLLYVPVCKESASLESLCETDIPYLGASDHYVIGEDQVAGIRNLSKILLAIARSNT